MASIVGAASGDGGASSPPVLRMRLDTTSFDETDDFGVDAAMLKSELWEQLSRKMGSAAPVLMSNGQVRRRLRWKPRNMNKKPKPRISLSQHMNAPSRQHRATKKHYSSDASQNSFNSNLSFASRFSKRSEHSFGSMATQLKSNTTKALAAHSQVDQPSIGTPTSFDGLSAAATMEGGGPSLARQVSELSASSIWHRTATMESKAPSVAQSSTAESQGPERRAFPPLFRKGIGRRRSSAKSSPAQTAEVAAFATEVSSIPSLLDTVIDEAGEDSSHLPSINEAAACATSEVTQQDASPTNGTSSTTAESSKERQQDDKHDDYLWFPKDDLERHLSFGQNRSHTSANMSVDDVSKSSHTESSTKMVPERSKGPVAPYSSLSPVVAEDRRDDDEVEFASPEAQKDIYASIGPTFDTLAQRQSHSPFPHTTMAVPADLDDASCLEAEKNLKAIHDMASEHLHQREYEEALEVFEEILRGQLARYGETHFRIGTALHNIGMVHMRRGDYQKAIDVYQDAIIIRKITLSPDHPDVAVSLAQLGVAYLETRQHKNAIEVFREALRLRRSFYGPKHPKVAKVLNNIGCALYELNEMEVAKVAFDEALEIQRSNLRDIPTGSSDISNLALLSIASTLSNIGSVKLNSRSFDEASTVLKEALVIQQCIYGEDHPIPRQTADSLRWIEQTTKYNLFTNFFSQLVKTFTMTRSESGANASHHLPQGQQGRQGSSDLDSSQKLAPLSNSILDAVEQKLENSMHLACGEPSGQYEDDRELKSQYSF